MTTALVRLASAQERSAGDIAQARELLNQGFALREAGDAQGALEKFRSANTLIHTPITATELGRTYALLGRLVEARETFLSVGRLPVAPEETSNSMTARTESAHLASELRARIPSLTVRVRGVPEGAVAAVTIDGATVTSEALGAPRLVDSGAHRIFARSTTGGTAEATVDLKEGEAREVELEIASTGGTVPRAQPAVVQLSTKPSPAVAPWDKAEPESPPSRSYRLEWSLIAGGAAIGAAGVVLMIVEASQGRDARDEHDKARYDAASTGWTVGLAGALIGAAAVVGGGVLFATSGGRADDARGSHASLWLGVGANKLSIGGTW